MGTGLIRVATEIVLVDTKTAIKQLDEHSSSLGRTLSWCAILAIEHTCSLRIRSDLGKIPGSIWRTRAVVDYRGQWAAPRSVNTWGRLMRYHSVSAHAAAWRRFMSATREPCEIRHTARMNAIVAYHTACTVRNCFRHECPFSLQAQA
jgi:hypothetical protein